MPFYNDQLDRKVDIPIPPQRIISLVPSQTELLYDLGLKEEVIGITKFCIHPNEWFRSKTRIGGTKTVDIDKVKALNPDLILANKEENVQSQIEALEMDFPIWISDVNTMQEALDMIQGIGQITNKKDEAIALSLQLKNSFSNFTNPRTNQGIRTCYMIWKDPYMSVGGDTFIHDILTLAGFSNLLGSYQRYPIITIEELQEMNCELLLLSSEPYPFKQKHLDELKTLLPTTKILLVDGEAFSWYGSRLLHTPAYLQQLHQEIIANA
jgi:ABC-type Fe3+-hydroxamate transport system substrate-binding protein